MLNGLFKVIFNSIDFDIILLSYVKMTKLCTQFGENILILLNNVVLFYVTTLNGKCVSGCVLQ